MCRAVMALYVSHEHLCIISGPLIFETLFFSLIFHFNICLANHIFAIFILIISFKM